MTTYADPHVADSVNQALAAGMSESTTDGQMTKAINILNGTVANSAVHAAALAAAVTLLTNAQKHNHDPRNNNF